jgi:uncharacterized protein (TIGR01777 family)
MGKYIIAGGTGFIGTHLTALLRKEGHEVYVLTTQKSRLSFTEKGHQFVYWQPKERYIDEAFSLSECKLINLAGAGVAEQRWTAARKKEILDSRIDCLDTLYLAVEKKQLQVQHLVSSSAIGYYGEGYKLFAEDDLGDDSFLSSVCRKWEEAAWQFARHHIPVAVIRTGIVLGKEGGALKEFLKPLRFGVAGIPSDGHQIYSWIHVEDISRIFYYLSSKNKEGIFNGVAPHPASVNTIFAALIRHIHPFFMKVHAPDISLKLLLGEMSIEVLKSTNVSSEKILQDGFRFLYEEIDPCIDALMT